MAWNTLRYKKNDMARMKRYKGNAVPNGKTQKRGSVKAGRKRIK
jgi:hypothetical protein